MATIKYFIAAKAFIRRDGKILLVRESGNYKDGVNVGQYDVPGGRLDPNETLLDGLQREVREETGLGVSSAEQFFQESVVVKKNDEEWHITRNYFACDAMDGDVVLSEDHDEFIWIDAQDYPSIGIIPNLKEVFEAYLTKFPKA